MRTGAAAARMLRTCASFNKSKQGFLAEVEVSSAFVARHLQPMLSQTPLELGTARVKMTDE